MNDKKEIAVFGGGCFWCTEAVFKMLKGVSRVLPGYSGGTTENPTYAQVSSGKTGHAEVIYIEMVAKPCFVANTQKSKRGEDGRGSCIWRIYSNEDGRSRSRISACAVE